MEERPPFYYDPHPEGNRVSRDLEKDIEESTKSAIHNTVTLVVTLIIIGAIYLIANWVKTL
jgi:hypothetical protein